MAAVEIMDAHVEDADAFIAADNRFHQILANATQNDLILTLIDPIMELLSEQRKQIFWRAGWPAAWATTSQDACLTRSIRHDPEAARSAMQAHLRQVGADVAAALEL